MTTEATKTRTVADAGGAPMPRELPGKARIVTRGRWLKIASVHDEIWLDRHPVNDPVSFIGDLRASGTGADLFTFAQTFPDIDPRFDYHIEWDNLAVAPTEDYDAWWKSLPQASRKNVRRAGRRGVETRCMQFDDELAAGIKEIYDETPLRQGRRFPHYGKDLETVRRENMSYVDRSEFIGAYHGEELIGFIKMVAVGPSARIMQIVSKDRHQDKRPTNALLSKAMEVCCEGTRTSLVYGQFVYGRKENSPVTEFKRRNGFSKALVPRYIVPLTLRGRMALKMKLHRSWKDNLPEPLVTRLLDVRRKYYERKLGTATDRAG